MSSTLVIQLARFGDLVQTKRLLASLAPEGNVHLLVDRSLEALAKIIHPGATVHTVIAHGKADPADVLIHNQRTFFELSAQDFSAVYNCNFAGMSLAVTRLFDPSMVRGHVLSGPQVLSETWTSLGFRLTRERRMAALNLVDFWAHLHPNPVHPKAVNPVATPKGGGLGVVMSGREARRSLPVKILAKAAQAALARTGSKRMVLLGTDAESPAARELVAALPPAVASTAEDLCGKTDWHGLVEEVAGLDAVLTPDTGTMHLAAHLGVPVLGTFLSSAWCHETGPYGQGHTVWQANLHCAPCLESAACPHKVACLQPFSSPDFLRALGKDASREVPGMTTFASVTDELGVVYTPLAGSDMTERAMARRFLASHTGREHDFEAPLASRIYTERDWMVQPRPNFQHFVSIHD